MNDMEVREHNHADHVIGHLVKDAVFASIPIHRNTKNMQNGTKRVWDHKISEALKACKVALWQWREAGEPSSKTIPWLFM